MLRLRSKTWLKCACPKCAVQEQVKTMWRPPGLRGRSYLSVLNCFDHLCSSLETKRDLNVLRLLTFPSPLCLCLAFRQLSGKSDGTNNQLAIGWLPGCNCSLSLRFNTAMHEFKWWTLHRDSAALKWFDVRTHPRTKCTRHRCLIRFVSFVNGYLLNISCVVRLTWEPLVHSRRNNIKHIKVRLRIAWLSDQSFAQLDFLVPECSLICSLANTDMVTACALSSIA